MQSSRIQMAPGGPTFSRTVPGLMRLNAWEMTPAALLDWIKACLDMGVTTFDHADIYGGYTNEARFGEALKLEPSIRDRMELVTKCGIMLQAEAFPATRLKHYDTRREHIIAQAEQSLKHLQTDHLDVLLIHRPDPLMNAEEVAEAFTTLKQQGKVLYFGVSNFTPSQFELLSSAFDLSLVTNQVQFSPLHVDPIYDGTFDQCQRLGVAPMIWSPLGGGGLFTDQPSEREARVQAALRAAADAPNTGDVTIDQIALAWTMQHPARPVPVIGTGKIERVKKAVEAESIQLERQQWFEVLLAFGEHLVP
jgi:predicted oxidoreductase